MVSTRKKRNQQKRQLSHLNETLNDFVIGSNTNESITENETLESQTDGRYDNAEEIVNRQNSAFQYQVIGNNIDDKIRKVVDNAVKTVENRMHDAVLTVMDNVVIPRVEMAVRSTTGSSGHGATSTVQNPDRSDFIGKTENTPLKLASSRLDLIVDRDRIDENRDIENFEDGDFPALRPNYDRQAHAHHKKLK